MTIEDRIAELMGLHKEQLARMIAESESHDDSAKHDAETAAVAAEVNGEPDGIIAKAAKRVKKALS